MAYSFAAKGHYYQLAEAAANSKPKIVNSTGMEIPANF